MEPAYKKSLLYSLSLIQLNSSTSFHYKALNWGYTNFSNFFSPVIMICPLNLI